MHVHIVRKRAGLHKKNRPCEAHARVLHLSGRNTTLRCTEKIVGMEGCTHAESAPENRLPVCRRVAVRRRPRGRSDAGERRRPCRVRRGARGDGSGGNRGAGGRHTKRIPRLLRRAARDAPPPGGGGSRPAPAGGGRCCDCARERGACPRSPAPARGAARARRGRACPARLPDAAGRAVHSAGQPVRRAAPAAPAGSRGDARARHPVRTRRRRRRLFPAAAAEDG